MLTTLLVACSLEALPSAPPSSSWHWVDATGAVVSDGPEWPVIVDDRGLAWPLGTDGYFEPELVRERWFISSDCTGRAFVPHPVHALQPTKLAWDPGAYSWLPADGPEVSTAPQRFGSRLRASLTAPQPACEAVVADLGAMVPVDVLERGEVEGPHEVFLPPFRRVR